MLPSSRKLQLNEDGVETIETLADFVEFWIWHPFILLLRWPARPFVTYGTGDYEFLSFSRRGKFLMHVLCGVAVLVELILIGYLLAMLVSPGHPEELIWLVSIFAALTFVRVIVFLYQMTDV